MSKFIIVTFASFVLVNAASAADIPREQPVRAHATVGKAPVGKAPIGKRPIGKAPAPVRTRG